MSSNNMSGRMPTRKSAGPRSRTPKQGFWAPFHEVFKSLYLLCYSTDSLEIWAPDRTSFVFFKFVLWSSIAIDRTRFSLANMKNPWILLKYEVLKLVLWGAKLLENNFCVVLSETKKWSESLTSRNTLTSQFLNIQYFNIRKYWKCCFGKAEFSMSHR